ncbi:MAG: hypothetical protein AAGA58_13585 [Verrucomicrobiota bacterium]
MKKITFFLYFLCISISGTSAEYLFLSQTGGFLDLDGKSYFFPEGNVDLSGGGPSSFDSGLITGAAEGRISAGIEGLKGFLGHAAPGPEDPEIEIGPSSSFNVTYSDSLSVSAFGLSGTSGTMKISYRLDGFLGVSENGSASISFIDLNGFPSIPDFPGDGFDNDGIFPGGDLGDPGGGGPGFGTSLYYSVGSENPTLQVDDTLEVEYAFIYGELGQEVFVSLELSGHLSGFGAVDFLNTAAITQIELLDQNGQTVNNASISSGSGTNFNSLLIPEPSSLVLAAMPLILLARRRRHG